MRLTNEIKDKLTQNLLEASPLFTKARNVVAARQKLVEDIRQALLKQYDLTDEKIEHGEKLIVENPFIKVYAGKTSLMRIAINGERRDLRFDGLTSIRYFENRSIDSSSLKSKMFFAAELSEKVEEKYAPHDYAYPALMKVGKLHDRLIESDAAITELFSEVYAFRVQVKGALSRVQTINKLKEVWPDAVPYLPELVKQQSTAVALPVETLNAICGLPK